MLLLEQRERYNLSKVPGKPHPGGPPRRALCYCFVQYFLPKMKESSAGAGVEAFVRFHEALAEPSLLDKQSIQLMSAKSIKDGRVLVKLRAHRSSESVWQGAVGFITTLVQQHGGEYKSEAAPAGPNERKLGAWAYGKSSGDPDSQ
mmetsp:Transcript_44402/g.102518  ORF Transcript_44402/g.102518 Transcript_44402/m.102518 type:complete len:146 (+) Transcript_44402:2-439(+)